MSAIPSGRAAAGNDRWAVAGDERGRQTYRTCLHLSSMRPMQAHRPRRGCEGCLREGTRWVHLRQCVTCGYVGCCDSSPRWHARAHYQMLGHPIAWSLAPGEVWAWCYADELFILPL